MKEITFSTTFTVYESLEELNAVELHGMQQAIKSRENAYAPYSNFTVGTAILLENNEIITGSNQENAAYPSGLCAERVAIFYAGAQFPNVAIKQIFITAGPVSREMTEPIPPCGACRQSIAEYELKQENPIELFFMGTRGKIYKSDSLKNLLPFMFDKKHL